MLRPSIVEEVEMEDVRQVCKMQACDMSGGANCACKHVKVQADPYCLSQRGQKTLT